MMRLFTKTWHQDLKWIELAIASVSKMCTEPIEWHIAIEDEDLDKLAHSVNVVAREKSKGVGQVKFHLHKLSDKWPEWRSLTNGYMRQQWIKMTSHRVMGNDIFWHWDSDLMAKKQFSSADFIGPSGRAIYWFSQFNALVDPANPLAGVERRNMLKEVFQIQDPSFEWMRCLPIPSMGAILNHFEGRPEYSRSCDMMKRNDHRFSEFNVLGQFSLMYFPDAFEWRNTYNYPRTWGGGIDDPGAIVCQFWSWSNDTSQAAKLVEDL